MSVLTEHIILSRSDERDLCSIKELNCWGSDLIDISIIRKMKIVEILSLGLNNIASLADLAYCSCLKELYLHKNNIENLSELYYLNDLEHLHELSLEDNPCTKQKNYRFTVLQILPNLKVLDNICVYPDEVQKAMICCDTLLYYSNSSSPLLHRQLSVGSMNSDSETALKTNNVLNPSETDRGFPCISSNCSEIDNYAYSSDETSLGYNAISVIPCKQKFSVHQEAFHAKVQTMVDYPIPEVEVMSYTNICSSSSEVSSAKLITTNKGTIGCMSDPPSDVKKVSSQTCSSFSKEETANAQDFKLFSRKEISPDDDNLPSPIIHKTWKTPNSNLLSAVLCLVKELDYASLEVVRNAIHCRMGKLE